LARKTLSALLRERGLITLTQAASHVAGEPLRGSWWSHPEGKRIYRALPQLAAGADVLQAKLVEGRQTCVHRRRLWPALVRVQRKRALWPALSPQARRQSFHATFS
jgi:hypothetical protein